MPAVCLWEARLEASDVGALVREAHPCGGGPVGVARWPPERTPSPPGAPVVRAGGGVPGTGVR